MREMVTKEYYNIMYVCSCTFVSIVIYVADVDHAGTKPGPGDSVSREDNRIVIGNVTLCVHDNIIIHSNT